MKIVSCRVCVRAKENERCTKRHDVCIKKAHGILLGHNGDILKRRTLIIILFYFFTFIIFRFGFLRFVCVDSRFHLCHYGVEGTISRHGNLQIHHFHINFSITIHRLYVGG